MKTQVQYHHEERAKVFPVVRLRSTISTEDTRHYQQRTVGLRPLALSQPHRAFPLEGLRL